ncbi:MAG: hypothetical protein ACFFCS_10395 [Candidatus Hodarchaeota archaeon]
MSTRTEIENYVVCPNCKQKLVLEAGENNWYPTARDVLYMWVSCPYVRNRDGKFIISRHERAVIVTLCKHCWTLLGTIK